MDHLHLITLVYLYLLCFYSVLSILKSFLQLDSSAELNISQTLHAKTAISIIIEAVHIALNLPKQSLIDREDPFLYKNHLQFLM